MTGRCRYKFTNAATQQEFGFSQCDLRNQQFLSFDTYVKEEKVRKSKKSN
jgi:hypothetical protein